MLKLRFPKKPNQNQLSYGT